MTQVSLLRVGVDLGCGGTQGPLFDDGSFDFVFMQKRELNGTHSAQFRPQSTFRFFPHPLLKTSLGVLGGWGYLECVLGFPVDSTSGVQI